MNRNFRIGALLAGAGVVVVAAVVAMQAPAESSIEAFDGTPASPANFTQLNQPEWDVQVQSRDEPTWFALDPINAQHGSDCSAPPATHPNTSYEGAVFICNNHLMTTMNAGGYGAIYLTPDRVFDFSSGGSITFDLSTNVSVFRDWWDITISPFENNLALPLISDLAQGTDLQGYAKEAIHISTDNGESAPRLKVVKNGSLSCPSQCGFTPSFDDGIPGSVNQAATRQPFKLTIADGRIRFERLGQYPLVYWDNAATVNFTSGIVQFGHHAYNPEKDGQPNTWHWDNIQLSNSTPFTMIKADRRYTQGGVVNFATPAPANAYLRFAGICRVSIDGQLVNRAPTFGDSYHADHFSSYFVPIPAGKQSATFSFVSEGTGCIAKDFAIWSLDGSAPTNTPNPPTATGTATQAPTTVATNTPTSTPPATATNTPQPPTSTPTVAPSATPTSLPTATPTATPRPWWCAWFPRWCR